MKRKFSRTKITTTPLITKNKFLFLPKIHTKLLSLPKPCRRGIEILEHPRNFLPLLFQIYFYHDDSTTKISVPPKSRKLYEGSSFKIHSKVSRAGERWKDAFA